jgi:uncharacterized protein YndB with AHSA1/START domain
MSASAKPNSLPVVTFDRVFDAPRELMFRMWTEAEHLRRWWAPHDFTVPHAEFDARPGGKLRIDFRGPDGEVFPNYGEVREVRPFDRLVFTAEYRHGGDRLLVGSLVTVTFRDEGKKTRVTIRAEAYHAEPEAAASLAGMEEGWTQQLEKLELEAIFAGRGDPKRLAVALPDGRPYILMRRMLDGPRELVWTCMTQPQHFSRWWGPRGYTNEVTDFEPRVGGKWRVIQRNPEGEAFIFRGEFRELVAPERLVRTFGMENMFEGIEAVETYILEDFDGRTRYTAISRFPSVEARDGMAASGMEWGAAQSMDRLEELLREMQRQEPA